MVTVIDQQLVSDESLKAILRAHGLQVTAPRVLVLQALRDGQGHMRAEKIHAAVLARHPVVNMVTIYRTLETFEAHGLAVRGMHTDRITRWEWVAAPHHHLLCARCGALTDLDDAPFQQLASDLAARYGVRAAARHLSLDGLCAACVAEESEEGAAQERP